MQQTILPSLYEGFPVSVLEAAANGLECIISDTVTDELKFIPGTTYLQLDNQLKWVERLRSAGRKTEYNSIPELLKKHGFDISDAGRNLEVLYKGIYR